MNHRLGIVGMLICLLACHPESNHGFRTVVLDGQLETRLPKGMWPENDMHPSAGAQYADAETGHFMLMLADPVSRVRKLRIRLNLTTYHHYICENVLAGSDTGHIDTVRWVYASKWKGIESIVLTQAVAGSSPEVTWRISSFMGDKSYFHLIQWFTKGYGADIRNRADTIVMNLHETGSQIP